MKKKVITFLMAVFLVMSSVPLSAEAAEPSGPLIDIDETNFPDEYFRKYLSDEYDPDGDGKLNPDEVTSIKGDASNAIDMKSLDGIELFPNLTSLELLDSDLDSLDVSQNPKLEYLTVVFSNITSLDVSKNQNLKELNCSYNGLSNLVIGENPNLIELTCWNNQLSSLDVSKVPNLKALICHENQLTSLNLSQNSKLEEVNCETNRLTSLSLGKNPNLTTLKCYNNQLTNLNIGQNPNLTTLLCNYNQLTSLDISHNSMLNWLRCDENQLTSLDVSQNPNLTTLTCGYNQITGLDLSKNPSLKEFICNDNQLKSLDLSKNPNLEDIYCYNNQLTSLDLSNNKKLEQIGCDFDSNFKELILPAEVKKLILIELYHSEKIADLSKIKGLNFSLVKDSHFDKTMQIIDVTEAAKAVPGSYDYVWYQSVSGLPYNINFNQLDTSPKPVTDVSVSYRTHVQSIGWQPYVSNGTMAGTSGLAKRLEGINIQVSGNSDLGIQYTTHVQSYGWLPWSSNGDMSGTEGEAKRLEAIKIQLTGADRYKYDVYYRVHAQSYGWLGWAKNGAPAGTAGYAKRLEAIQILVVKKGNQIDQNQGGISSARSEAYIALAGTSPVVGAAATSNTDPTIGGTENPNVSYRTHVQSFGWQGWKYNGQMSGTSGQAKRLEGINIKLTNKLYSGGICYTTHVQSYGWQGDINNSATWKKDGEMSGTSGQAKRLEAIMIKLTDEMADHYDVYYRVHAQSYGWLGWAKNGEPAGTAGYAKRLEGIQIVLVPKGGTAPSNSYGGINSANGQAYIAK